MRKIIKVTSIIVLAACYVTMLTIFTLAYMNPTKIIKIGIDIYGEAHLEAAILLLSLPFCVKFLCEQIKLRMLK